MPLQKQDRKPAADTKDEKQPVFGNRPGGSWKHRRRKTDVKQPRLKNNATKRHSLTLEGRRELEKSLVAEHVITPAKPLFPEISSKCNVENRRNMEGHKKSGSCQTMENNIPGGILRHGC